MQEDVNIHGSKEESKAKIEELREVLNKMLISGDLTSFDILEISIKIDELIIEYHSK